MRIEHLFLVLAITSIFIPCNAQVQQQIDSLVVQQEDDAILVSLDSKTENKIDSIAGYAKPSSLQELVKMPNGMNSVNLAFWISLVALLVSIIAIFAQFITAKNTANAPYKGQISQFEDLVRHLYRNLACSKAMRDKFTSHDNSNPQKYPSEIHFLKLKTLPEDVFLPVNNKLYPRLHELKLLIRNYNEDIDVALQHIKRKDLQTEVINGDFDNLLYKPFALISKIVNTEDAIASSRKFYFWKPRRLVLLDKALSYILLEHFIKLADKENEKFVTDTRCLDLSKSYMQNKKTEVLGCSRSFEGLMNMFQNPNVFECNGKTKHTRIFKRKDFIHFVSNIKPGSDAISKALDYIISTESFELQKDEKPKLLLEQYKLLLKKDDWDLSQILYIALDIDSIIESKKVIKLIDYEK